VTLKTVAPTTSDVLKELNKRIDMKTSTEYVRLKEVLTADQLKDAIQDTRFTLNLDLEIDPPEPELKGLKSMKKPTLLNHLIRLRKRYFELDPEAKEHIQERTKQEFEEEQQCGLTMEEILDLDIMKLCDEVLSRERYNRPHGAMVV
jgi:hypothetical protein